MKYIVALTGGIGSGKSTISSIFFQLGISIIDADVIARQIIEKDASTLKTIIKHFKKKLSIQTVI